MIFDESTTPLFNFSMIFLLSSALLWCSAVKSLFLNLWILPKPKIPVHCFIIPNYCCLAPNFSLLGVNNRSLDGIQGGNLGESFYLPDPVASLMELLKFWFRISDSLPILSHNLFCHLIPLSNWRLIMKPSSWAIGTDFFIDVGSWTFTRITLGARQR